MSFYDRHILPRLIDFACGLKRIRRERARLVPEAQGKVLEIGVGSGLNFPFYDPARVEHLWALEPSPEMRSLAAPKAAATPFPTEFIGLSGEEIPLETASVDTVVTTYTLCTIPDVVRALREMRRVLRPGGRLLFLEHGAAPEAAVRKWQHRLTPAWKRIGGGCHLDRDIAALISEAGFCIDQIANFYLPGPRFLTFTYRGVARA
ncbi:MAG TPA: class I SAM-dependent methyltransferase [Allosphingosinicella sp.]|nr:class I SAM-dependent methyltransferase [Allosphingosinicella sp.]